MDTGREIKIHRNIPAPQEPKRTYYPQKTPNPYFVPEEKPIPVPDWPTKVPQKVEAE